MKAWVWVTARCPRIGTTTEVEVRDPGGIERSVGKARRIVDQRPKG